LSRDLPSFQRPRVKSEVFVAAREFRQIARMRSFWLTLLIIPLSMVVRGLGPG
jgi:hypothetical protein